jgi:hypothetical protein
MERLRYTSTHARPHVHIRVDIHQRGSLRLPRRTCVYIHIQAHKRNTYTYPHSGVVRRIRGFREQHQAEVERRACVSGMWFYSQSIRRRIRNARRVGRPQRQESCVCHFRFGAWKRSVSLSAWLSFFVSLCLSVYLSVWLFSVCLPYSFCDAFFRMPWLHGGIYLLTHAYIRLHTTHTHAHRQTNKQTHTHTHTNTTNNARMVHVFQVRDPNIHTCIHAYIDTHALTNELHFGFRRAVSILLWQHHEHRVRKRDAFILRHCCK